MFIVKIMEFISNKRMDLFQSMFFNLYERYNGDTDRFLEDWFKNHTYFILKNYFIEEYFKEHFENFFNKRKNVIKSYVKAYWSFCISPDAKPNQVKVALDFFGIKELSYEELKKKYRSMVKKYHPDIYPDKKEAVEKMIEINHYYQILKAFLEKYGG